MYKLIVILFVKKRNSPELVLDNYRVGNTLKFFEDLEGTFMTSTPYTPDYSINSSDYDALLGNIQAYNGALTNPVLDANGEPIDYNGKRGIANLFRRNGLSSQDTADLLAAYQSAQAQIDAATITAMSEAFKAKTEAEGAVNAAMVNAEATKYAADQQVQAVIEQGKTDKYIADEQANVELEKLEVERESIDKVDAVNAQANLISANALTIEAEAKETTAEAKLEEAQNSTSSTWPT